MIDRLLPDLPRTRRQWITLGFYLWPLALNMFPGWAPNQLAPWRLDIVRWGAIPFVLALLGRSRRPGLVALLGIVLGFFGGDLYVSTAMLCIAYHRRGRVATLWTVAAFAMICLPTVPLITMTMDAPSVDPVTRDVIRGLGATLLLITAPSLGGAYLAQNQELIVALHARTAEIEANQELMAQQASHDERARIAGEMHDVLGHKLSLITMQAGALEVSAGTAEREKVEQLAGQLRETARDALVDLRGVLAVLGTEATGTAPQPSLVDVAALVERNRRAGAKVTLEQDLAEPAASVPAVPARTAYRVVQEALTNANKHSPGGHVEVRLDGAPGRGLSVNVLNYRLPHTPAGTGNRSGLTRLAERVRLAGGTFETTSTPDTWLVSATLPWPLKETP